MNQKTSLIRLVEDQPVQFNVSSTLFEHLENVRRTGNFKDIIQVIGKAVNLFLWAVQQQREGFTVGSWKDNEASRTIRTINMQQFTNNE